MILGSKMEKSWQLFVYSNWKKNIYEYTLCMKMATTSVHVYCGYK